MWLGIAGESFLGFPLHSLNTPVYFHRAVPPMTLVLLFFAATLLLPCHAFAFAAAPPPFSSSIASSRHRVTTVESSSSCGIGLRNATLSSTKPLKLHSARGGGEGGMVESSSINNDDDTAPLRNPPSNLALFKFYFPCLALWISGPLLSLVDTSFIGLSSSCTAAAAAAAAAGGLSSASQLAALGPATTFIDGSLYLFAFLNVATTNLYASALATASAAAAISSSTVATRKRMNRLGNDVMCLSLPYIGFVSNRYVMHYHPLTNIHAFLVNGEDTITRLNVTWMTCHQ